MSQAQSAFNEIYTRVSKDASNHVEYSKDWENGTGYLDGAVNLAKVPATEVCTSVTNDGRRIVLVGTEIGTVVIFERYTPSKEGVRSTTIVANGPRSLNSMMEGGLMEDTIHQLAGGMNNIGHFVASVRKAIAR